jgi:hypothetical protein
MPARRLSAAVSLCLLAMCSARADYQSTVLGDSPIALYPLNLDVDTSMTASDASGNGNDGTYVNIFSGFNNATGPSAYIPGATTFNGMDTSVDLSAAASLTSLSGAATLEAWVKPADSSSFGDILGKGYNSSTYQESYIRVDGPYGAIYDVNLGNAQITGGQQQPVWTHLVLANNGSTTSFYVNGVLVQSKSDTAGASSFTDPWAIGNGTSGGSSRRFSGDIAQVAFYSHGLSAAQVLNHYCVGLLGVAANNAKPIITAQPQGQSGYVGGTVTFSVGAISSLSTANLWLKNGTPLTGKTNATLTLSNLKQADAGDYSVVVGNANGTTNSVAATLTVAVPNNLLWSASGNSGVWDAGSSANWVNRDTSATSVFSSGDAVLFDDSVGAPTSVTVSGTVLPSLILIDTTNNSYSFSGGTLGGTGNLVKKGPSALSIVSSGGFTGTVTIAGGTVYAGNNCFSSASSITVTNDGTLDMGGGTFNSGKALTISGAGVNGMGAVYNSYNDYPVESLNVTLAGDSKFAGSARWDLGNSSQISGPHNLILDWGAGAGYTEWRGVGIGGEVVSITLTNGTFGAKDMDSSFQNPATLFTVSPGLELSFWSGGWNGSLHLMSGATANLWAAPAALNGTTITMDDSVQWRSWGNSSTDAPINSAIVLNGVVHCILGDHNLVYTNLVSGPGGLVLDYWNHAYVFSASNTYTGPTIINNGPQVKLSGNGSISHSSLIFFGGGDSNSTHLDVSARSDSTLTLASGQTLGGIGAVSGNLTVAAGATLAPAGTNTTLGITTGANVTGAITATGNIALNGAAVLKLNGTGTNDSLSAGGSLVLGGTLTLVNVVGAPLAAGDTFKLFSAGSGITGSFSAIVPSSPGAGLAWNLSQLASGILSVVSTAPLSITTVKATGDGLVFGGGGGTANGTYYVVASTNVAAPASDWTPISTNAYDSSGNFSVTNAISGGTPKMFYRIKQ